MFFLAAFHALRDNLVERFHLFYSFRTDKIFLRILYCIYAIIFTIPFLLLLAAENVFLTLLYILSKIISFIFILVDLLIAMIICFIFKTDKKITPISFCVSILFLGANYLFYGLSIVTCTPNFIWSFVNDEKIFSYFDFVEIYDQMF